MANIVDMAKRMFSRQPEAYSRITRTPITLDKNQQGSQYLDKAITMNPSQVGMTVPHESAHAIYDQAGLEGIGARLAGGVPQDAKAKMGAYPNLYNGSPDTVANEGLAFSIGNPDATGYVNQVAGQIKDPKLRDQLLRLHENKLRTNELGGLGRLMN